MTIDGQGDPRTQSGIFIVSPTGPDRGMMSRTQACGGGAARNESSPNVVDSSCSGLSSSSSGFVPQCRECKNLHIKKNWFANDCTHGDALKTGCCHAGLELSIKATSDRRRASCSSSLSSDSLAIRHLFSLLASFTVAPFVAFANSPRQTRPFEVVEISRANFPNDAWLFPCSLVARW